MAGAEQGCQKATDWTVEEPSNRLGNFWDDWGGGTGGNQWAEQVRQRKGVRRADRNHGGAKECVGHWWHTTGVCLCLAVKNWEGGEMHALSLCPVTPNNNKKKRLLFWILPFYPGTTRDQLKKTIHALTEGV